MPQQTLTEEEKEKRKKEYYGKYYAVKAVKKKDWSHRTVIFGDYSDELI